MKILVTGLGVYCSLGDNVETFWAAIEEGKSGISPITNRFNIAQFDSQLGAMVSSGDNYASEAERLLSYGCSAAAEAIQNAQIDDRSRVALVLGTCNGLLGKEIYAVSRDIARDLGLGGPIITVSTACASSAHAIGFAADLVRRGMADFVLTGGVDTLTLDVFAGFHSLRLISKTPCAPFSMKLGTTLGEGAGFMILESDRSVKIRGVKPITSFMGYGLSADAFHDTKPDPFGMGMARALNAALTDAGLPAEAIDYLNAHGTATAANDSAEWRAIQRTFGQYAEHLPVSSSKSFLGHAQGAAGVLEAITTLLAMKHKVVPPTLNYTDPRPNSPSDPVTTTKPRSHVVQHAICTNAAFGGVNTALVFGDNNSDQPQKSELPRSISLVGTGMVVDCNEVSRYVPHSALRGLDTSARFLASAVATALVEAGIRLRSSDSEGIGLFVGQEHVSPESLEAFGKSIKERGITHLSASAFTRMVVNYATGVCCRLFGMKGPTATLATDPDSGLTALVLSADFMAWRDDTNYLLAGAVDEPGQLDNYQGVAASVLLKAGEETPAINLTGWALAADSETAVLMALAKAHRNLDEVEKIDISGSPASAGLIAVINAINALKNNKPGPYLISNRGTGSVGAAVVLERSVEHAA